MLKGTQKISIVVFGLISIIVVQSQISLGALNKTALVIGNSNYLSAPPLTNPVNDAHLIAQSLEELGFKVILKLDASQQVMDDAIVEFGKEIENGGVGLFFYAGHGIQSKGRNYLLPIDAIIRREKDLKYKAIDTGTVLDEMDNADNNLNIVILDACRNNPIARSFRGLNRGLAILNNTPSGTLIAYSTAPGSVAADGEGKNSPYTKALVTEINKPGKSIEAVFKDTAKIVKKVTKENQIPWFSSSITNDFYFIEKKSEKINKTDISCLNDLHKNMKYSQARDILLSAGFQGCFTKYQDISGKLEKEIYFGNGWYEIKACAVTDRSPCRFEFEDIKGNRVFVVTEGGCIANGQICDLNVVSWGEEGKSSVKNISNDLKIITEKEFVLPRYLPDLTKKYPTKDENISLAMQAYRSNSKDDAKKLEDLAENGNKVAAYLLSRKYLIGISPFSKNLEKANRWLLQSTGIKALLQEEVNRNDMIAISILAVVLRDENRYKNQEKVFFLLSKAANLGYDYAQRRLGVAYQLGEGTKKDLTKAVYWYKEAAEQGQDAAQFNLGNCFFDGLGVPKRPELALFWYQKSAVQGFASAQRMLGWMYEHGLGGLSIDLTQAQCWYEKAAKQGNPKANADLKRLRSQSKKINTFLNKWKFN